MITSRFWSSAVRAITSAPAAISTSRTRPTQRAAIVSLLHEFEIDDPDVKYPSKDSFRYIHGLCEHYAKARGGCRSLQEFKKISIVEAKGYCYGWHFYQTGDADLVVSSEDALFGHPAFRYVGVAPRLWTWVETMGLRRFQEMLFTGRPFTAKEMYECGFVNSVVPRDKLEEETLKYATACARTRPIDTVAAQKTFLEIYKQYRGEYMGSLLTAMVEGLWPYMKHEPGDLNFALPWAKPTSPASSRIWRTAIRPSGA